MPPACVKRQTVCSFGWQVDNMWTRGVFLNSECAGNIEEYLQYSMRTVVDWKNLHAYSLSERLASLGITGIFKAIIKPLNTIVWWCTRGFVGVLKWAPMLPKDASLSDSFTFDRCCFSSLLTLNMTPDINEDSQNWLCPWLFNCFLIVAIMMFQMICPMLVCTPSTKLEKFTSAVWETISVSRHI